MEKEGFNILIYICLITFILTLLTVQNTRVAFEMVGIETMAAITGVLIINLFHYFVDKKKKTSVPRV